MRNMICTVAGIAILMGVSIVQAEDSKRSAQRPMEGSHSSSEAVTVLIDSTIEGGMVTGRAIFVEAHQGVKIKVEISGTPKGRHGIHIHENGSCEDHGNAAGGHFNPEGVPHGDLVKDGFTHAHAGDLGNIEVNERGIGTLERMIPGLRLDYGERGILGRALILHEKADDFAQPTGNAGGRIACGKIALQVD